MKAIDIARKQVYFCYPTDPLAKIAQVMCMKNIGSVIVKDHDAIIGILTVNDMLRLMVSDADPWEVKAFQVMSSPIVSAKHHCDLDELKDLFVKHGVSRIVLKHQDEVVGIVRDRVLFNQLKRD